MTWSPGHPPPLPSTPGKGDLFDNVTLQRDVAPTVSLHCFLLFQALQQQVQQHIREQKRRELKEQGLLPSSDEEEAEAAEEPEEAGAGAPEADPEQQVPPPSRAGGFIPCLVERCRIRFPLGLV